MNAHPASAADGHSLAERHRLDTLAREIRGAGFDPVGAHLRLVTDPADAEPAARGWSPLSGGPALSPLAGGARAGGRLDSQGRLTCTKLLKGLGWEPHIELATYVRCDRPLLLVRRPPKVAADVDGTACGCGRCVEELEVITALDGGWTEIGDESVITRKWELSLTAGMCHAAGLEVPGEVVAVAVPALDAVVLTSVAYAITCLFAGLTLAPLPPAPHDRGH